MKGKEKPWDNFYAGYWHDQFYFKMDEQWDSKKIFAQCPSVNLEEKLECHSALLQSFTIQYFINNLYENIEDVPNKLKILERNPTIINNKILKTPNYLNKPD